MPNVVVASGARVEELVGVQGERSRDDWLKFGSADQQNGVDLVGVDGEAHGVPAR